MKLMTLPMYNYPFFLNMLTTFVYIPACFLYIIPMILFGSAITPEQRAIPQMKFAVMGLLDSIAGIMGIFAVNYIVNAGMIVLLQQAGIPISMIISRLLLGARYSASQYAGATVVIAGIIVTLIPLFVGSSEGSSDVSSSSQTVWSIVQVLSCIPMCLSSVYKEKALGEADIDVIYLNGWVSVYQFAAAIVFAIPSAFAMGVPIQDLPQNLWEGFLCFTGTTTINMSMAEE
jgi:drug/metabolite transporter (DMT)-like permease